MSRENVEIVRRAMEYWNSGDIEALRLLFSDDVVVDRTRSMGPDARVYSGIEDAEQLLHEWRGTWESFHSSVDEYIDAGYDVAITGHFTGHGRGSGVPVEASIAQVYTLRDGKIVRHVLFQSRADALAAIGLSPEEAAGRAVSG